MLGSFLSGEGKEVTEEWGFVLRERPSQPATFIKEGEITIYFLTDDPSFSILAISGI
jgi:hypothetical protein